uniref:TIL domain-containing protein n=1 Tax=Amblyomma maculatum TaxID=34609 RepID=G3MS86_AMBMU
MAKVAPACVLVFLVLFAAILLASGQAGPQANMAPARGSQSSNAFRRPPHHKRHCPRNEVFKRCQSSSCGEKKCYHLGQRRPLACTLDCVTGCFCKRRYYRNNNGKCVLRSQCPKIRIPVRLQPAKPGIGTRPE